MNPRTMRFGPDDLLEYNAQYQVLICRTCQYGVQKSAVESHLLKHKIYRSERRQLLQTLSQLHLVKPDLVTTPSPRSSPVEGLHVISGYTCMMSGCERMYASLKRIKQHYAESHGPLGAERVILSRPAVLQTFFRGTKVRYFEVSGESAVGSGVSVQDAQDDTQVELCEHSKELDGGPSHSLTKDESVVKLDMKSLTYFHHFLFDTGHTLPSPPCSGGGAGAGADYWCKSLVTIALKQELVMTGLLAISTYHMAYKETDKCEREMHSVYAARLQQHFDSESSRIISIPLTGELVPGKHLGLLSSILALSRLAVVATGEIEVSDSLDDSAISPKSIVLNLKHLVNIRTTFVTDNKYKSPSADHDVFKQAAEALTINSATRDLVAIRQCLQDLPMNIATALGRPADVKQATIILKAIAGLVSCATICYTTSEKQDVLNAATLWLVTVPEEFLVVLGEANPAALVVLVHWAVFCLGRAGSVGFWMLTGLERSIVSMVERRLRKEDNAVRELVRSF